MTVPGESSRTILGINFDGFIGDDYITAIPSQSQPPSKPIVMVGRDRELV